MAGVGHHGAVVRRSVQLVLSCVVLGVGVALLLRAALGSDGYSTLINGLSISLDLPFVVVNAIVGLVLVAMAWSRHVVPGLGTIVQPVVVGFAVSGVMSVVPELDGLPTRAVVLALAFPVLAVGVAGYLGSGTGAGPTEAAAIAFDPPLPFRWSYSIVQGGGALVGWLLGAAAGVGTLLVIVLLGPMVDLVSRHVRAFRLPSPTQRVDRADQVTAR